MIKIDLKNEFHLPGKTGIPIFPFVVNNENLSCVTGVFNGAPNSFQFGINSFIEIGSITAPDKICPPISDDFSTTQTLISCN